MAQFLHWFELAGMSLFGEECWNSLQTNVNIMRATRFFHNQALYIYLS